MAFSFRKEPFLTPYSYARSGSTSVFWSNRQRWNSWGAILKQIVLGVKILSHWGRPSIRPVPNSGFEEVQVAVLSAGENAIVGLASPYFQNNDCE